LTGKQWAIKTGFPAANATDDAATKRVDCLTAQIRAIPAFAFAGLTVKAQALRYHTGHSGDIENLDELQDWPVLIVISFHR
jgi:hypothetical protein